ncbi:MAG: hypothetical protein ACOC9H_02890 [Gemmatimonadota bacterium]
MSKLHEVTLETLAGGAAPERFDRELKRVIKNIRDPNTDPEAKRKIKLEVTFVPGKNRADIHVGLHVEAKLAPVAPLATMLHVGEKGGEDVLIGYDPNQPSLFPDEQDADVKPAKPTADQVAATSDSSKEGQDG